MTYSQKGDSVQLLNMEIKATGCCGIVYLSGLHGAGSGQGYRLTRFNQEKQAYEYYVQGMDEHMIDVFKNYYVPKTPAILKFDENTGRTITVESDPRTIDNTVFTVGAIHWSDSSAMNNFANGEGLKAWFVSKGIKVETHELGSNRRPQHDGRLLRLYCAYINVRDIGNAGKISLTKEYTYEEEQKERAELPRVPELGSTSAEGVRSSGEARSQSRVV